MRYEIAVQQTSDVRSSIASAKRSTGIRPSLSGRTWTTSAPRSSWACAIWPTVGNSNSEMTIRGRSPSGSALTSALTACETDVVTAISSGSATTSRANVERAASARSTQCSHSAPCASQPSRYASYASRTSVESAPCEHEFAYVVCSKIGKRARTASPTPCVNLTLGLLALVSAHRPRYALRSSSCSRRSFALPSSTIRPVEST